MPADRISLSIFPGTLRRFQVYGRVFPLPLEEFVEHFQFAAYLDIVISDFVKRHGLSEPAGSG